MKNIYTFARILAAIILLQTLYFKFTSHPESVNLFSSIGMEPNGRIATGIVELIAGLLLLIGGQFIRIGAVLGILLMIGAIYYHVTILGYDQLFLMACVTLICCLYVVQFTRKEKKNINAL